MKLFSVPFVVRVADIDETMDNNKPAFDEVKSKLIKNILS